MRLLKVSNSGGQPSFTKLLTEPNIPRYAILSHTWGADEEEITFAEMGKGPNQSKAGYKKIQFCTDQVSKDKLEHFWIDTCCINKADFSELAESITSMFRWYAEAEKCYVYLPDVEDKGNLKQSSWEPSLRKSRWFTRGWTLQELLAPRVVEFYSREGNLLGTKETLESLIHEITRVPVLALRSNHFHSFPVEERFRWVEGRNTKRKEDKAYCMLGIFDVTLIANYGEGERALQRLKEEIAKREISSAFQHTHRVVPRSGNSLFTGRRDLLDELQKLIRDALYSTTHHKQCRIVLTGVGGQGKSEMCLQLAERLRQSFWGVFWIDVSTVSTAQAGFLDVAQQLGVPASTWEAARRNIDNLKHPWLLVLDNADDPEVDYQQYFPGSQLGTILLTSRNDQCLQYATKPVSLEGLLKADAQDLLFRAGSIRVEQRQIIDADVAKVANLLQSHPLALIQAGAYVARGYCTFAQYPEMYQRQRSRLLKFRPKQAQSRYGDVYATFEASAEVLKASGTETANDALELLAVMAVFSTSSLPLSIFEAFWKGIKASEGEIEPGEGSDQLIERWPRLSEWHKARIPSFMGVNGDAWDPTRLLDAVDLLRSFSLVSLETTNDKASTSLQPLIHSWARDRQNDVEKHESWLKAGCVAAFAGYSACRVDKSGFATGLGDYWNQYGSVLRPHIEALMDWDVETMFSREAPVLVVNTLVNCGWLMLRCINDRNRSPLPVSFLSRLFSKLKLSDTKVVEQWTALYDITAYNLSQRYNYRKAILLWKQVLDIRGALLVESNASLLQTQYDLAIAYADNGQVKESILLLESLISTCLRSFEQPPPLTSQAQRLLGSAYVDNGQFTEAEKTLKNVMKVQAELYPESAETRLKAQYELARVYRGKGQLEEAVNEMRKVVGVRQQCVSDNDSDRLHDESLLASFLWKQGERKEALEIMSKVVRTYRHVDNGYDAGFHDRLWSEHNLAGFLWETGSREQAFDLINHVVEVLRQVLDESDSNRLASEHRLATYLWNLGRQDEGLEMMSKVVDVGQKVLDESNSERLASEYCLATYLWKIGRRDEGLEMMSRVAAIDRQMLDENDKTRQESEAWLRQMEQEMAPTADEDDQTSTASDELDVEELRDDERIVETSKADVSVEGAKGSHQLTMEKSGHTDLSRPWKSVRSELKRLLSSTKRLKI
jgi:tetratricopeptide (TPR) repeat protein